MDYNKASECNSYNDASSAQVYALISIGSFEVLVYFGVLAFIIKNIIQIICKLGRRHYAVVMFYLLALLIVIVRLLCISYFIDNVVRDCL